MANHLINSQLICADYDKQYPQIVSGKGSFVYDEHGRGYLDCSGCTAAVTSIGHGVEEVASVVAEQAATLAVHPTHLFDSPTLQQYLENLCAFAPEGFNHAWTISGGTEAIENAVKLAYQYHRAKGRTGRRKVLGRWGSYHGNSILALDVGGLRARRDFYTDLMVDHPHVSHCFPYRREAGQRIDAYEDQLINEFAATVETHKDELVCFVAEPVVGAALGAVSPTPNYFSRIAEICRQHDILMVADEVMTGFGRTGKNFGCEHFGTHADILACAKGITGGYFPMGAVICHDRVYDALRASGHPFYSGQTYACIPLAAATGSAVLSYIEQHDLVQRAHTMGATLKSKLDALRDIPCVGDVRGEGLFLAIEFVSDQTTKAPIDPAVGFAKAVEARALDEGLVTYACRGTVDGRIGDHMLFSPPLTLSEDEATLVASGMRTAIRAVWSQL